MSVSVDKFQVAFHRNTPHQRWRDHGPRTTMFQVAFDRNTPHQHAGNRLYAGRVSGCVPSEHASSASGIWYFEPVSFRSRSIGTRLIREIDECGQPHHVSGRVPSEHASSVIELVRTAKRCFQVAFHRNTPHQPMLTWNQTRRVSGRVPSEHASSEPAQKHLSSG